MKYSRQQFNEERDLLLTPGNKLIPSKQFCEFFMKKADTDKANRAGYYNDSEDYHSWGLALWEDVDINAEVDVYKLRLWNWIHLYEALSSKSMADFLDAVEVIKEDLID